MRYPSLILAAALAAVSCRTPPTTMGSSSAAISSSTSAIRVKDAYTSVTVRVLGPPAFLFPGTDRKYHVAYELELQNTALVPATIQKL
jgi:hypothetical protein